MTGTAAPLPYTEPREYDWPAYRGRYQRLTDAPLNVATATIWLDEWNDLYAELIDVFAAVDNTKTADLSDPLAERRYLDFVTQVWPEVIRLNQQLKQRLLALTDFVPDERHAQLLRQFRHQAALYREPNVALSTKIIELSSEIEMLDSLRRVTMDGEELTLAAANRCLEDPDRSVRAAAWHRIEERRLQDAPAIDALFLELLRLRRQQAANADLPDYAEFRWAEMNRLDYTNDDALRFDRAAEEVAVPALAGLMEQVRQRLNAETLRPWDLQVPLDGGPPMRPFDGVETLVTGLTRAFTRLHPQLGAWFDRMHSEGYLNLEARPNKLPNYGYSVVYPKRQQAFIFGNVTDRAFDVTVVTHEAGHAFHFLALMEAGVAPLLGVPMEFAEVASQGMEVLVLRHLARSQGGFYSEADLTRVVNEQVYHLILSRLVMVGRVDAFQQWLYRETGADVTISQIDAKWLELSRRFYPQVDLSGLEDVVSKGWQSIGHIIHTPFYYLEYGLAWLGALQLWRAALHDPQTALDRYLAALRLGGSKPLPELYAAAGAELVFDAPTMQELIEFALGQLRQKV